MKIITKQSKLFTVTAVALAVAGCATLSSGPIASGYNGDSVNIQTMLPTVFTGFESIPTTPNEQQMVQMRTEAEAEASRICQAGVKKQAEYASERINKAAGFVEFLFLCLNA